MTEEDEETYFKCYPSLVPISNIEIEPIKKNLDQSRELLEHNLRKDLLEHINPQGIQDCQLVEEPASTTLEKQPQ